MAHQPSPQQQLVALWHEPRLYAVYTRSRHEKHIADELLRKSVETLVPVYETIRQWKSGRHRAQLPLFPAYTWLR